MSICKGDRLSGRESGNTLLCLTGDSGSVAAAYHLPACWSCELPQIPTGMLGRPAPMEINVCANTEIWSFVFLYNIHVPECTGIMLSTSIDERRIVVKPTEPYILSMYARVCGILIVVISVVHLRVVH